MDPIQQLQYQNIRLVQRKARSLANLINAIRCSAHFHPIHQHRLAWVERVLYDIRFDHVVGANTDWAEALHPARAAVVDFCLGHIGVRAYGQRLRDAFRNRPESEPLHDGDIVPDVEVGNRANEDDSHEQRPSSSTSRRVPDVLVAGMSRVSPYWVAMYLQLCSLTLAAGSTNDGNDARVEFAREYSMDLCTGLPGMVDGTDEADGDGLVSVTECIRTLKSVGFLNKSMVSSKTMMMSESDASGPVSSIARSVYPVFVFGSNYIRIGSDAGFTRRPQPNGPNPPALEDDAEVRSFTQYLVRFCGGDFVPDQEACRAAAVEKNTTMITSLSRDDVSLQLAVAMPDGRFYTANVFYLKGGESCTTSLRYRRRYLSNACKCENPLAFWRLAVSVAAVDGTEVDLDRNGPVFVFVTNVIRAFHHAKEEHRVAGFGATHAFVNKFSGLLFVNYLYDSRALGGMDIGDRGNLAPDGVWSADVCPLHRWLRTHANVTHWHSATPRSVVALLSTMPQMLIVCRPMLALAAAEANGPDIFVNYKTYDDIVSKYVLLTLDLLKNGYAKRLKAVSYKSGDNYWVFSEGTPRGGGRLRWMRVADRFAIESDDSSESGNSDSSEHEYDPRLDLFVNLQRDVDDIFRQTFSAPTLLFVHTNVLTMLGFNLTAVNRGNAATAAAAARTFTHTDRNDVRNSCTVICSSPTVVIDETTGRLVDRQQPLTGLLVLQQDSSEQDLRRVLHSDVTGLANRFLGTFDETVVSLNDYWPDVSAVKVSFKDRALRHMHFVFFMAPDGQEAVRRLSASGLTALYRLNMRSRPLLPAPVVYTLQQMYVHFYADMDDLPPF